MINDLNLTATSFGDYFKFNNQNYSFNTDIGVKYSNDYKTFCSIQSDYFKIVNDKFNFLEKLIWEYMLELSFDYYDIDEFLMWADCLNIGYGFDCETEDIQKWVSDVFGDVTKDEENPDEISKRMKLILKCIDFENKDYDNYFEICNIPDKYFFNNTVNGDEYFDNYLYELVDFYKISVLYNEWLEDSVDCLVEYDSNKVQEILNKERLLLINYLRSFNNIKPLKNKQQIKKVKSQVCYIMKDKSLGYYKIGKSSNPKQREKTLQAEKPSIKLIKIFKKDYESELHNKYKKQRKRGEWFDLNKVQVEYICKHYK